MIEHKNTRNPLKAEKSPRNEFHGFDFSIPEAPPPKERWHYPETDWGLMAKFGSQKQTYDNIYRRQANAAREVEEIRVAQAINTKKIEAELAKRTEIIRKEQASIEAEEKRFKMIEEMLDNPEQYANHGHPHSHRLNKKENAELLHELEEYEKSLPNSRAKRSQHGQGSTPFHADRFLDPNNERVDHSSNRALIRSMRQSLRNQETKLLNTKDITELKATKLKDLQHTHPDVLEKFRAERAAKYVNKRGEDALVAPNTRFQDSTIPFRPGGGSIDLRSNKPRTLPTMKSSPERIGTGQSGTSHKSNSSSGLPMEILQAELDKTNQMIAQQQLKMSLNNSTRVSKLHHGK